MGVGPSVLVCAGKRCRARFAAGVLAPGSIRQPHPGRNRGQPRGSNLATMSVVAKLNRRQRHSVDLKRKNVRASMVTYLLQTAVAVMVHDCRRRLLSVLRTLDPGLRDMSVYSSHAWTIVCCAILPALSSTIARHSTFVPSG